MGHEVDLELTFSTSATPEVKSTDSTPGVSAPRTPRIKASAPISIPSPYIVSAPASQAQTPSGKGARTPGWSRAMTPRTWAIILLTLAFIWQLYTLYLLVQLHD
ncbi:hypothetical protein POM88_021913 [Heracleum sosnowskyi]|uniref:Uncharacterized protein n=1 Tax=Heracleum sosnowskyi TaxID=360622 RepID=A0AAD8IGS4_9APIA|nr:hypothetical protein POM88_021913 [Heracleum sosnowskyi]